MRSQGSALDYSLKIIGVSDAVLHVDQAAQLHDVGKAFRRRCLREFADGRQFMQQVHALELSIARIEIDVAIQCAHQVSGRISGEREV